ncbi:hypothetical protein U1Q18_036673 [Sarracenia purpurea var. burkii]
MYDFLSHPQIHTPKAISSTVTVDCHPRFTPVKAIWCSNSCLVMRLSSLVNLEAIFVVVYYRISSLTS